jgi:hypothetical protein
MSVLRSHPHVKMVLRWAALYRGGELDVSGLAANLYALVPAMEGDLPSEVRAAIRSAQGEIESVHYMKNPDEQRAEVERILRRIEDTVKRQEN